MLVPFGSEGCGFETLEVRFGLQYGIRAGSSPALFPFAHSISSSYQSAPCKNESCNMEDKTNNQEIKEEKSMQQMERLDLDQSLIPTSPYYIHPRENPGQVLTTPSLNETNYNSWSRNMRMALLSKNKLKFMDGSMKTPTRDDPLYEAWERANVMVLSWIIRTLSPQIAESVIYIESARDLWNDLKERFTKGDYFRISDLLQEMHSAKQGERNITQFFTDIKTV